MDVVSEIDIYTFPHLFYRNVNSAVLCRDI